MRTCTAFVPLHACQGRPTPRSGVHLNCQRWPGGGENLHGVHTIAETSILTRCCGSIGGGGAGLYVGVCAPDLGVCVRRRVRCPWGHGRGCMTLAPCTDGAHVYGAPVTSRWTTLSRDLFALHSSPTRLPCLTWLIEHTRRGPYASSDPLRVVSTRPKAAREARHRRYRYAGGLPVNGQLGMATFSGAHNRLQRRGAGYMKVIWISWHRRQTCAQADNAENRGWGLLQ